MTGLQVAHQPGQWMIWAGCLLLVTGLAMALYFSHIRIWGIVATDRKVWLALLWADNRANIARTLAQLDELTDEAQTVLAEVSGEIVEDAPAA